jgi:transposase-like protein
MDTKQQILALLAEGRSTAEIAKRLGVSQRTVQRWVKIDGTNPVKEVLDEVVKSVACSVRADIGSELRSQALQLLRLSGKSLDCLEEILESTETKPADKLKACQIVGDWVGFQSRADLLSHTLEKYGLEVAITPEGDRTLQEQKPRKPYPLQRDFEFVVDANGTPVGIRKA